MDAGDGWLNNSNIIWYSYVPVPLPLYLANDCPKTILIDWVQCNNSRWKIVYYAITIQKPRVLIFLTFWWWSGKESLIGLASRSNMVSANKDPSALQHRTRRMQRGSDRSHFCVLQTDSKRSHATIATPRTSYGGQAYPLRHRLLQLDYWSSGGHRHHAVGHSIRPTQFLQQLMIQTSLVHT